MKGYNTLILNQATMIEAVQVWLDTRVLACEVSDLVVTRIQPKSDGQITNFEISLISNEEEEKKG